MRGFVLFFILLFSCCVSQSLDSLSDEELDALDRAIDDEYRARATYRRVLEDHGEVRPFTNIVEAEEQHITSLQTLYLRYGLEIPGDTWTARVESYNTLQEACSAGVEAEIENAALYDELLPDIKHEDIRQVFTSLRDASRNNHLPAFQRCA